MKPYDVKAPGAPRIEAETPDEAAEAVQALLDDGFKAVRVTRSGETPSGYASMSWMVYSRTLHRIEKIAAGAMEDQSQWTVVRTGIGMGEVM